ncbi:hypothetical protein JCM24511_02715 [Saitozyma sp. JCM 24511]|nr:hypothetical protein JCM24511_02715 [Saitozyma sp. JCM 24511]
MKHGIKLRKLQRTPSHRWALLRNLVSALLHHEQIKTTLPKAKEAARMAEKIITLGKKANDPARRAAMAFLMPGHSYNPNASYGPVSPPRPTGYPASEAGSDSSSANPEEFVPPTSLMPKLFTTLSERYASRPGGYTRIHKFGRRPGDNAPHAIVELVDGPRDLRFEMVARAVGRESAQAGVALEGAAGAEELEGVLRERTKLGLDKVLRYRGEAGRKNFMDKAKAWENTLRAEESAAGGHRRAQAGLEERNRSERGRVEKPFEGRRHLAGERMAGMSVAHTGLGLARGALGRRTAAGADRTPRFLGEAADQQV